LRVLLQNFAVVFLIGFMSMAAALGFGSLSGEILSSIPGLVALRFFAAGMMVTGMVMWITLLRDEAGKTGLTPLFALLLTIGTLMLVANLIDPSNAFSAALSWGGLGLTGGALVLGLLAMLMAPVSSPVATLEPAKGNEQPSPHGGSESH
jgi:hypothetical protein